MNFHKTIGYLAALLLMLGIGVPDSFAQDEVVTKLTLSVSPRTLRDSTSTPVTVTATVGVTLAEAVAAGQTRNVSVAIAESFADDSADQTADSFNLDDGNISFSIAAGQSSASDKFDLVFTFETLAGDTHGDADPDDEKIILTATATGVGVDNANVSSGDNSPTISITDHAASLARNARSIRGTRVVITEPAADAYAPTGKDKIKVQVLRKGLLAAEFGAFTSVKVSLFNDPDNDGDKTADVELYSLAITDAVQLGTLVVPRVRTATLTGAIEFESGDSRVAPHADTKAHYTRRSSSSGYDKLEFRFHLNAGGGPYEYVYAVATFGLTGAPTGEPTMIESRDTETSIFPQNPSAFPDKVGNGRLIKIDTSVPLATLVSAITVTIIDGDPDPDDPNDGVEELDDGGNSGTGGDPTVYAGIGDKIKVSVVVADFPDRTLQLQMVDREGRMFPDDPDDLESMLPVTGANQLITGYSKDFGALEVLGASSQGNPLEYEVTVGAGDFTRVANLNAHPDDLFDKKAKYQDDNVIVRIKATVKDAAGNATPQTAMSPAFYVDSKPPVVTITYPKPSATDSTRFTAGVTQDYEFIGVGSDVSNLKPLDFKINEATTQRYIVIGTDTLTVGGVGSPTEALDDGEADTAEGYDLTDANTFPLKNPDLDDEGEPENKRPDADSKQGGAAVKLKVVAIDLAGNTTDGTPDGGDAIFDGKPPVITLGFPINAALKELDNKIGGPEQTQNPVFSINEVTDSILVRYEGGGAVLSVAGTADDEGKVDKNIQVKFVEPNDLAQGESYSLQIYARDITGNVGVSDPDMSQDLVFDNNLQNPSAAGFKVVSEVRDNTLDKKVQTNTDDVTAYAEMDSVVAGQSLRLTITAIDDVLDRTAITYAKDGVKVVTMDSDDNPVASVDYSGDGVTDNDDGSATLNGAGWSIGSRMVFLNSGMAGGPYTVVVKDLAADGTLNFKGEKEGITVDAADFAKFVLSAWEDGVDGAATSVWGDFDLMVVPTDKFGNSSLKTFFDQIPGTKKADSLNILDTRLGNDGNSAKEYTEVNVRFSTQLLEDVPTAWPISGEGRTFSARALDRPGREATARVDIDNTFIDTDDARSRNKSGELALNIAEPLDISITLWVPGVEGDQAGNEVTTPAGESVEVTARAEGLNEGDDVIFTLDGEAQPAVTADADGYAGQPIELSGSGTRSVTASSGQYSASLDVVFVEAPAEEGRVRYVDAEGNDVYNVAGSMEVDATDVFAAIDAFGTSEGDDDYNIQADVDVDGDVDLDDLLAIASHWGRVAVGPATKPLVLLPGINENAEFALSLGSERVVAGELVAVDVSLANVEALMGYGFTLNYETDKFEFVSVAPADEDLLTSTGGETPLFHHIVVDGQVEVVNGMINGTAISGGGDIVRFVFRVLREFEDNARFEIADGLVFDPSQLQNPAVVAGVLELQSTPREFALRQNFPNPFNPDTTIKYDLAESADVTLQIYNVLGQVIRTLVGSEAQNAGRYQIRWNGMDDRGVPVSSGVYFYQISAGKFQDVRKLMLLK